MNSNDIKIEDDPLTLPDIQHNGYYIVGDKKFNFKFNALEYASFTNQTPTWEFNTAKFCSIDWRRSEGGDIRNYYRLRAEQLRNKYDYLILSYSGGADSTTVLQSFLHNNIHLDEIICDWPLRITSGFKITNDPRPDNHYSEWELAIKPMLEYVRVNYPRIKITITDSSADLIIDDAEDTFTISHMGPYASSRRYRFISQRCREVNQKKDRVAVIIGTDKPLIHIEKNIFCIFFKDSMTFFKTSGKDPTRRVEYFFWSPDMPELIREQAHCLYQQILTRPSTRKAFFEQSKIFNQGILSDDLEWRLAWRDRSNLIKNAIYPDWDINTFQADKTNSTIYTDQHSWLFFKPNPASQSWESILMNRLKVIDPKYLTFYPDSKKVHSIKHFTSRLYPIGVLPSEG